MNSILTDGWGRENGLSRPVTEEATFVENENDCEGTVTSEVSQLSCALLWLLFASSTLVDNSFTSFEVNESVFTGFAWTVTVG
jgi:hypothetical protein